MVYMPPCSLPVGVPGPVHAPQPHHADLVHAAGPLGMTGLTGRLQGVGRLVKSVPEGVFLEVSVIKGGLHGAIP